jgi:hypothetical protein
MLNLDLLDISPVIGGESGLEVAPGPPVLVLALGPVILYILLFGFRIAGLIQGLAS